MSDNLLHDVLSCTKLPSLPAVAIQLLELTSDPDVAMGDIARLVQQDQALAGKVLKTVNSSFYGLSSPCASIDRAMGYLGLNTVKSLVLGFSLVETTKSVSEGFDLEAHWRRAIIGATGARTIARDMGGVDPEEAFTSALFQDMGMLAAFAAMQGRYAAVIDGVPHRALCATESQEFGFDHAVVGAGLAENWKLPSDICEAIRCHHNLDSVSEQNKALARAVSMGAMLCDAMDPSAAKSAIRKIERLSGDWYAKRAPDVEKLIGEVAETSKTLAKMFNQEIGSLPSPAELMAQAQDKTIEHQVAIQREAEELAQEALTDGLTRVPNRKRFDGVLELAYNEFTSTGTGFGVLFFDADKFKDVNDTHGHAAGDAVLVELARRTADTVGDKGTVCRYGGEEFAIIVPNATLDQCAALGEQVCSIIAATPFDLSALEGVPDTLPVTVSVGVSSVDAGKPERLSSGDQIVQEADECVYAAKEAGRNNVKVFGRIEANQSTVDQAMVSQKSDACTEGVQAPIPQIPTKSTNASRRILLVEDDALAATLVISLIKRRDKAVDIQWVKSGTKACIMLESGKFNQSNGLDLIICDFMLPGCNGHEVLHVAKGAAGLVDVPFFMLTGSSDNAMKDETLRLGAAKFIHKDEFCADVNGCLNEVFSPTSNAA